MSEYGNVLDGLAAKGYEMVTADDGKAIAVQRFGTKLDSPTKDELVQLITGMSIEAIRAARK